MSSSAPMIAATSELAIVAWSVREPAVYVAVVPSIRTPRSNGGLMKPEVS